jgi:archaemetzincin
MRIVILVVSLFLFSCQSNETQKLIVGIQPYGIFPEDKTDTIAKTIADFYQIKTIILPAKELYKDAFTEVKSPRYRADKMINLQKKYKADSLDFILGLTTKDISVTKKDKWGKVKTPTYKYADWGIMGLAYCPGNSCIVSSFRIQHSNPKTHFTRFKKVAFHEFGHNLGLPHCPDKTCVMTDAVESVKTIDNAKLALCGKCKAQLN